MKKIIICVCTLFLASLLFLHNVTEFEYSDEIIAQKELEYSQGKVKERVVFEGDLTLDANSSTETIKTELKKSGEGVTLMLELDNDYPFEEKKPSWNASDEEIDKAIRTHRQNIRKHFEATNLAIMQKFSLPEGIDMYVSKYSPYVTIEMETDKFLSDDCKFFYELSTSDQIATTYVQSKVSYAPSLTSALPGVSLPTPENMSNLTYQGSGVVVGVLEVGGIIDKNNVNFKDRNNTFIREEWYYQESLSDHADLVGAIVGGKNGIARKCTLLSVELSGNPVSEVDWMIARNVNIINNSWGEKDEYLTGNYKSNSTYFDHISRLNWITVVSSAGNAGGNSGKEWCGSPGLGYNVVTAGATTDSTNLAYYSSYKENFSVSKPTIVAPGSSIGVTGCKTMSGTSFSSPITAAIIALLMEEFSILKMWPEIVLAVITASANKMSSTYNSYDTSGLEDKVGAGKIDYERARSLLRSSNWTTYGNHDNDSSGTRISKRIYLTAGRTLRVSLAWQVYSNNKTNTNIVTDYDLHLANSNGERLKTSSSGGNNIEFIEYVVPTTGYYTVSAYQYGARKVKQTDYLSIAWLQS